MSDYSINNIRPPLPDEWECYGCGKTVKVKDMVVKDDGKRSNYNCPHCAHPILTKRRKADGDGRTD